MVQGVRAQTHPSRAGAYETWQNDSFSGAGLMPGNAGSLHEFMSGATREAGEPASTPLADWALKHRFPQPGTHPPLVNYTYAEHAPPHETVP